MISSVLCIYSSMQYTYKQTLSINCAICLCLFCLMLSPGLLLLMHIHHIKWFKVTEYRCSVPYYYSTRVCLHYMYHTVRLTLVYIYLSQVGVSETTL